MTTKREIENVRNKRFVGPILVTVVGLCWLLNELDLLPGVNWIWTGTLAAAGVLILAIEGYNKVGVVLGPFLICAALFSFLRSMGHLTINIEAPLLIIILGALLLLTELLNVPSRKNAADEEG